MGTFGERLRREREMRGITLDEIATATKISARNLRALEDEKFNQLPGGIFNRGFVRAYAKFLGIDEDQIVAEYVAASQDSEAAREQKLKAELAKPEFRKEKPEQEISLEPKSQWGTIAAIVLLAVLAYGGYSIYQKKKAERMQHHPQAQVVPQAVTPAVQPTTAAVENAPGTQTPAAGSGTTASSAQPAMPPATPPETTAKAGTEAPAASTSPKPEANPSSASGTGTAAPIHVTMKARESTWMEVRGDGKILFSGTLVPGTEKSFRASEMMEVKLGKAAGVELTYNGKTVENPANIQDVRKLTFTPSGYE